ncbi:heterokaryon incompatibility protein-domain-containing protein [Rhexocercosporidium sp. MPI-PUGE-AT-0058]|nr:heterokaryon incompatibility protein-domain-containing protein [Rhexocercosporidium sp. MPI-PUGE-AT-0058]
MDFKYSPLGANEFRLLTLHPRFPDSHEDVSPREFPISCTLIPYSRAQSPPYKALSYTWGDPSNTAPITVNGSTFHVTANLFAALEHIRDDTSAVTLWIDAICINQQDDMEKTEQVKMMKEIYDSSEHARAWLGPAGDGTDGALEELDRVGSLIIAKGLMEPIKEFFKLPPDQVERYAVLESIIKEGLAPFVAEAVKDTSQTMSFYGNACEVLSREYWRRVWIVQEIIVSPQIVLQCGKTTVEFPTLYAGTCYMLLLGTQIVSWQMEKIGGIHNMDEESARIFQFAISLATEGTRLSNTTKLFGVRLRYQQELARSSEASQPSTSGSSLFELVARIHVTGAIKAYCGATNPRDRIFALLGMANDSSRLGIQPDYDQSKTCSEVYTHAAREIIGSGQVDFLSLSQPQGRQPDLPSWVPDLRAEWILRPCGQLPWDSAFKAFVSSPESAKRHAPAETGAYIPNQIRLFGYQVDIIEEMGRPWTPHYIDGCSNESSLPAISEYLVDITNLCAKSDAKFAETQHDIYATTTDRSTAHKRVPVADQEEYGTGFIRRAVSPTIVRDDQKPRGMSYRNMLGWQRDRRPFLSENGYVGLAPLHAQIGDVIVVLENAKFPYILRVISDGIYNLVGEAYVHGIMYGEFLTEKIRSGGMRTFTLS